MNRSQTLNAFDTLTLPGRLFLTDADHLHREINRHLLDLGHDTVSRDDLHELLHDDLGYRDALDDLGRVVWTGIGLRAAPMVVVIEDGQVILSNPHGPDPARRAA